MRLVLIGLVGLASSGCGTLFSSGSQSVNFQSDPQGVWLYLDGQFVGKTPVRLEVDRDTFNSKMVMLKKEGFETQQFPLRKTVNSVAIFNLTSLTPWAIDAATGNMIEYSPNNYYIELESKTSASRRDGTEAALQRFVLYNYDNVLLGISEGGGEYVEALAAILHVPRERRDHFIQALQARLPELIGSRSPKTVIRTIQQQAIEYS